MTNSGIPDADPNRKFIGDQGLIIHILTFKNLRNKVCFWKHSFEALPRTSCNSTFLQTTTFISKYFKTIFYILHKTYQGSTGYLNHNQTVLYRIIYTV